MDSKKVQFIRVNGDTLKTETTDDEKKFRKTQFPDDKTILKEKVNCTSCGKNLKEKVINKDIHVHPVLDVLWCKKCEDFYSDGEFSADEDGSDKYCRWCAQGGNLYCCSYCSVAFCERCVRRNLPRKVLKDIEDDDWKCFICVTRPLWPLRAVCDAAKRFVDSGSKSRKTTRVLKAVSEESAAESEVSNKHSKRKRKNDAESTEEDKYNADSEDTTSMDTNKSKRKYCSSNEDNSSEKRSSRRRKVNEVDAKPQPHVDEPKKEKFEAIITDTVNDLAVLRKLLSKKEGTWKKDYLNTDVTKLKETVQQAEEEFSKFFSDIVTSVSLIEKSFKDKWSILQNELKESEDYNKPNQSTLDETEVENKDEDMVDVSTVPESTQSKEPTPTTSPRKLSNVSLNGTNDVNLEVFDDDNTTDANDKPAELDKTAKSISDSLAVNVSSIIDSLDSDEENELRNQNTSLNEEGPLEGEQSKPSNGTENDAQVIISDKEDDNEVIVTEPTEKVDSTLEESNAKLSLLQWSSDAATTDNEKAKQSSTDSELSGVGVLHSDQDDLQKTKHKKKKTRKELNSLVSKETKSPNGKMDDDATDDEKEIRRLGNLSNLKKRKSRHSSESDDKVKENVTEEKSVRSSIKKKKTEKASLVSYFGEASGNDSDASNISFSKFNSVLESKNKALLNGEEDLSKKILLFSSDDEKVVENCKDDVVSIDSDEAPLKSGEKNASKSDEKKSSSKKSNSAGGVSKNKQIDLDSSEDEFRTESVKKEKSKWRQDRLLKGKLSETDTSDEEKIIQRNKQRRKREAEKEAEKSNHSSDSEDIFRSNKQSTKSNKRRKAKVASSGSEFEINDDGKSGSDDSVQIVSDGDVTPPPKSKKKRRRIRNLDNSDNSDDGENDNTPGSASKGRKNIRKLLKEEDLAEITKRTAKEEEERKKRISERQAVFNESFKIDEDINKAPERLVLDFDPETKKEVIVVHKDLVRKLKPHQAKGVKFMWDSCFESVKMAETSPGGGCILAHCMGLGKTLQVITLVHTVMRYPQLKVNRVLILCPLSTVLNWVAEFDMWLQDVDYGDDIDVFHLNKTNNVAIRADMLNNWFRRGGVMVLGYEMFRNLVKPNSKVRKKLKDYFNESLLDPGPDLVVCDEGHMLKNEQSAISQATMRIGTKRRIVLTGTPLQNNLTEYHCMVQFVKQNLLGDKKEFLNRFANPITNGQYSDSTSHDVRVMKRRAHVLHKMLDGVVQRFDYNVLTPFLPSKHEFVILVSLSDLQAKLYEYYIDHYSKKCNQISTLFKDYQIMRLIWTHPYAMKLSEDRKRKQMEKKMENDEDSEGSLRDFVVHSDESEKTPDSDSNDSVVSIRSDESNKSKSKAKGGRLTRGKKKEMGINDEELVSLDNGGPVKEDYEDVWWKSMVTEEEMNDYRMGPKLVLLFAIIQQCENIGDKVLVFSQSIPSLDMIEYFLEKWEEIQANDNSEKSADQYGTWQKGIDYFRLDGQTSPELRTLYCNSFNKTSNSRSRLFLISTKAGGLGINLTAANRVIIFDASWNPSYDVQSIFRIYRFGQSKPCYIYRFLSQGTMEEKIYERQVTKLSISCRVVDEQQIDRHFNNADIVALYEFNRKKPSEDEIPKLPKDRLMAEILKQYKHVIVGYHEHDSLLENQKEEELTEEERKQAWEDYENEKKGMNFQLQQQQQLNQMNMGMLPNMPNEITFDRNTIMEALKKEHPNVNESQLQVMHSMVVEKLKRHYIEQMKLRQMQQALQMKAAQRQAPQNMFIPNNPQMRNLDQAREKFDQTNTAGSSAQK